MPTWRKLHTQSLDSWDIQNLSCDTCRLFWHNLSLIADKEGRGYQSGAWLRSKAFPLRQDISSDQLVDYMKEFEGKGMVRLYSVNGRDYFEISNWSKYQSTDKEGDSNIPASPDLLQSNSRPTPDLLQSNSVLDVDVDRDRDIEVDAEKDCNSAAAALIFNSTMQQETIDERFAEAVYREVTGNVSMPPSIRAPATEMILDLQAKHPAKDALVEYLKPYFARWRKTRGKTGKFYSALSPGWLEWALAGEMPGEETAKNNGKNFKAGKYAEFINS